MEVLHANEEQYKNLNGYKNDFSLLEFTKDALDRWIVGMEVLKDTNFMEIYDQLNVLDRVEYLPIIEEEQ
jgi:hypothetical protein